MAWWSVMITLFSYLALPLTILYKGLLIALAPILHLINYILHATLVVPYKLLAKFETLYIYFGVAAVIGLATGSILYASSTLLISILNLTPTPEPGRPAASVRAARERRTLEAAWESSFSKSELEISRDEALVKRKQSEWLEQEISKRKDDQRLLGQTIIEEDDDSEEGF